MVYNYLLDLYQALAERKNEIEKFNNGEEIKPRFMLTNPPTNELF